MILETKRMILRQLTMDDVDNLLLIFRDPIAMEHYPSTKDVAETKSWIQWNLNLYANNGYGLWAAIDKKSGEFLGQVGLTPQEVEQVIEIEIGYLFVRKFWGKRFATEGALACREYGFHELNRNRLISLPDPLNLASRRVAEKIGMVLEKEVTKWNKQVLVYAVHKDY
ncbi:GNAT family N-acetyltransferase [Desmospora activa]|uniref:RimJ/RimL family protein N-acetyltransferase n=1 Tax=Desmospora activa DSM 45169 TaxID=1121389 RepID=A0A2T4ZDR7_9BACL|nr:GNAT family N-acetyltransferase [Desmospora activa]PTM60038.1 RimJ/RimL family protein N-acetyltransferase [Desmospora activa DSM 45169]